MKKLFFAITIVFTTIAFISCEKEINDSFKVSQSLKDIIDYDSNQEWVYDAYVYRSFELKGSLFVSDTIARGSFSELHQRLITTPKLENTITLDTTFLLIDSVYLFGEYRIFQREILIRDTIKTRTPASTVENPIYYSKPKMLYWDLGKDDALYNDPDTVLIEYFYTVKSTLDPMHYTDTMYVSGKESGSFELTMRNRTSSEEYHKTYISSKLDKDLRFIDLVSATSSGYEYFRRDLERARFNVPTMEFAYNQSGSLDTTLFNPDLGVASYDEIGSYEVNGKTYDNVIKIVSNFNTTTIAGEKILNNVEIWYIKGFGMIKMDDKTSKILWTLK